jgi:hypothetical protein
MSQRNSLRLTTQPVLRLKGLRAAKAECSQMEAGLDVLQVDALRPAVADLMNRPAREGIQGWLNQCCLSTH